MDNDSYQYTDLSPEDAQLAWQAGLMPILNDAHEALFKVNRSDVGRRYELYESLVHESVELQKLQNAISFALELIGEYSNERFGVTASLQDRFFQRKYEQETFFVYLFIAIQSHKGKQIPPIKVDGEIINTASHGDYPAKLKIHEDKKQNYFTKVDVVYTEKQLYAAGVYYMIPFFVSALKENDAMYMSVLWSSITNFREGADYVKSLAKHGGQKSGKLRSKNKDLGYKIFVKHRLHEPATEYPDIKPFNGSIAQRIKELMPKRIKTSIETIEKKWVPEFLKRAHEKKGE